MSLIELIKRLNGEGEPLSLSERAALQESQRRRDAWDTFVLYHDNAMWAREDAERKKAENAYLPPEAVAYMLGEIERRKGRAALRDALEAQDAKQSPDNVPPEAAGNGNDGAADLGGPASDAKADS